MNLYNGVLISVYIVITLQLIATLGNVQAQPLQNACSFNQFRCSDGSACLLSEKLCNGKEDCPSGEDENGNSQWDCSLTTLSTECSRHEFRCRFGGCILKTLLCDGTADCWGATDESYDLCRGMRPTRRPISSINKITTNRPIRIKPTPTPAPPTTSVNYVTSTEKPISKPTSAKIQTPTTAPTLISAAIPDTTAKSTGLVETGDRISEDDGCETLQPPSGAQISCSLNNFPVKCTDLHSPEGTLAYYKCSNYWDPPKTGSQVASRECRNGQWTRLNRNWRCYLQCGDAGGIATGFITNGYDSLVGRWPWHVGLFQENPPNSGKFEFFCGGSLISRGAVLTAAHCITKSQTSEKRTDRILALLGKYNRTFNNDDAQVQTREIIGIEIPEYYTPKYYEQDIAIVWLDREADISERVRPVCLPSDEDELEPGVAGTLAGWGRWQDRTYPEKLQMAELPVTNVGECRRSHASLAALSRSTTFCAGYKNGTSACDGDSGGGLVFEENRKYFVQGIVSAGINSYGQGGGCDPKFYTIFTKVSKFRTWIDRILDQKEGRI